MKAESNKVQPKYRDRIVGLKRVRARDLVTNPKNWRLHPDTQRTALAGMLERVGIADALIAVEREGKYVLVDGHLRADMMPDQELPVLVVDLTEEEADAVLASHDMVTILADFEPMILSELITDLEDSEYGELIKQLADGANIAFNVSTVSLPSLAMDADRVPVQQITFSVSDEQMLVVKDAIERVVKLINHPEGTNKNGNALVYLCEGYLEREQDEK